MGAAQSLENHSRFCTLCNVMLNCHGVLWCDVTDVCPFSQLGVAQLEDSDDGVLLVGAMAGNMGRYEGLLQDVRIFSWKLDVGYVY